MSRCHYLFRQHTFFIMNKQLIADKKPQVAQVTINAEEGINTITYLAYIRFIIRKQHEYTKKRPKMSIKKAPLQKETKKIKASTNTCITVVGT